MPRSGVFSKTVTTYWDGDLRQSMSVQMLPQGINEVVLAFLGPMPDSTVETSFINSNASDNAEIGAGLCFLKANRPKVRLTISFLDTPQTHWSTSTFNPAVFVQSVFAQIQSWGLQISDVSYNIDLETGGNFIGFNPLIAALNTALLAENIAGPRISLVGYTGSSDECSIIQFTNGLNQLYGAWTMDYYDTAAERMWLAALYASWIGGADAESRVCILGKAPLDGDPGTPIAVMQQIVAEYPELGGIGIWPLVESVTAPSITEYGIQMLALANNQPVPPTQAWASALVPEAFVGQNGNAHTVLWPVSLNSSPPLLHSRESSISFVRTPQVAEPIARAQSATWGQWLRSCVIS